MAEERDLTIYDDTLNAIGTETDESAAEPTKEELHQRMEQARDSISQTVNELKDTVSTRVEEISGDISRRLDWREYVMERPITFSVAALVAGFAVGALLGGGGEPYPISRRELYSETDSDEFYEAAGVSRPKKVRTGPSLYQKVTDSEAFQRLQTEAEKVGERLIDEAVAVGNEMIVPAVIGKLREVIEEIIPAEKTPPSSLKSTSPSGESFSSKTEPTAENKALDNEESGDENNIAQSKANTLY